MQAVCRPVPSDRWVHGVRNETNDFGRNPGHLLGHMVGILAICGNEPTDDLRVVNMLAGLGLETYTSTGENHLTVAVFCQYDIIVEYAKNVHVGPSDYAIGQR